MSTVVADLAAKLRLATDKGSFAAGDRLLTGVKRALTAVAGLAAVNWAKNQITQVAATADHFAKLSQSLGVPMSALQELSYAAGLSGVSTDELAGSLSRLTKNLSSATDGSTAQARAFREAKVSIADANGGLRSADSVLGDLADRFASMPDGTKKTALAMKLFGQSGSKMIPMLNAGRGGLAAMRAEAHELGLVIDDETAKSFEQWNDDSTRLKASLTAIKILVARALLPAISRVTKALGAWLKRNRELIAKRVTQGVEALGKAFSIVGRIIGTVFDIVDKHSGVVTVAIGSIVAALAVLKLASVGAAIASAIAWAISLWPFVLLGLAIVGLIFLVEHIWTEFERGEGIFFRMYNAAKKWLGESTLGKILTTTFDLWIKGWQLMIGAWLAAISAVVAVVKGIVDTIGGAIDTAKKFAEGDIAGGAGGIGSTIMDKTGITSLRDAGGAILEGRGWDALGSGVEAMPGGSIAKKGYDKARDFVGGLLDISNPSMPGGASGPPTVQVSSPQYNMTMTVNGGDPAEVRRAVDDAIDSRIREADVLLEGDVMM
jgi:hypothetical protein